MSSAVYGWLIGLGLLLLSTFFFFVFFGLRANKNSGATSYSFLRNFPQELFEGGDYMRRSARILLISYAVIDAFAASAPLLYGKLVEGLIPFAVLLVVAALLKDVALVAMSWIEPYVFKPHLFSFVCFGGFAVIQMALSCILFANHMPLTRPLSITFAVLIGVVGLTEAGFMVNPKLSDWTRLNTTVDEEGNVDASRPKVFVLAFTQWSMMLLSLLGSAISLLGFSLLALAQM